MNKNIVSLDMEDDDAERNDNFIIEEYKTLRKEIESTKSKIFKIVSFGITGIPILLSFVNNISAKDFVLLEAFFPFLISTVMLLFLSEHRNLMRCGKYIKECIEPAIKKHKSHTGWEKWLEEEEIIDIKKEEILFYGFINKFPNSLELFFLDEENFGRRAVDRLIVLSFFIIFFTYYSVSSWLAIVDAGKSTLLTLLYILLGLFLLVYFNIHYKLMISTLPEKRKGKKSFIYYDVNDFFNRKLKKYLLIDVNEKNDRFFNFSKLFNQKRKEFLAVDIGGTNSRFAIFSRNGELFNIKHERREGSNNFDSFEILLSEIKALDICYDARKYKKFVIAVPGAVTSDGLIHLPYVRWKRIEQVKFKKQYPHAVFINDFVAQAYGCLTEATANSITVLVGNDQQQGDIAIVGAGTGTGHGTLKKTRKKIYECVSSEAGHIPFPFLYEDKKEIDFRKFLIKEKGIAIPVCNDVVSGPGLSRLHELFTGRELPASEVVKEISIDSDTTKYFARFYGRACRNYVVSTLTAGGTLYISGGVAIKNSFLINNQYFTEEFLKSSTTTKELLAQISVKLIQDERIGLFGAAYYGVHVASLQ